jgi:hypothetical protein
MEDIFSTYMLLTQFPLYKWPNNLDAIWLISKLYWAEISEEYKLYIHVQTSWCWIGKMPLISFNIWYDSLVFTNWPASDFRSMLLVNFV